MNATKPNRLPRELVSSTAFLLKKLGMAAKDSSADAYEDLDVRPFHHAILAALDEGSRDTQGAIADALGYDRGQLVGWLDELEELGLVERRRDPSDRRRQVVQMTPAGRKMLTRLRTLASRLDDEFLEPLNERERATLHDLLLRLADEHVPSCAGVLSSGQTPAQTKAGTAPTR
jgi:DNA-binding MarR family transcriptional regulator